MKLAIKICWIAVFLLSYPAGIISQEKVSFKTEDGFKIYGIYYKGKAPPIILLHMLRRTKEDWKDFAERLAKEGFAVLAIDLRGHGESTKRNGKTIRVKEFKRGKDFLDIKKDVKAAKEFLKRKKLDTKDLILIGASIGANIALNYAIEDKDVKKLVLLSPGRDYSGVKTLKAMKEYDGKLFICASKDDPYSFSSVKELYRIATCKKKMVLYKNAGHGTRMFGKEKQKPGELGELLLEWLKK